MQLFEIKRKHDSICDLRNFVAADSVFEALKKYARSRIWLAEESQNRANERIAKNFKYDDGSQDSPATQEIYRELSKKDLIQIARENLDVKSVELVGSVIQ